ncbi:hypothetical protein DZA21_21425 [Pseudomonas aeruginosa]|nr:hypothetical protein DOM02_23265 [Pseudomonas aeruginosa]RTX31081.1 hypothetical protein DZA21_21425 [Pseudomonas aeruginosa]
MYWVVVEYRSFIPVSLLPAPDGALCTLHVRPPWPFRVEAKSYHGCAGLHLPPIPRVARG